MSKKIVTTYLQQTFPNKLQVGDVYFKGDVRYYIFEVKGDMVRAIEIARSRSKTFYCLVGRHLHWLYNQQQVRKKKYETQTEVYGIEYFLGEPRRQFLVKVFRYDFRYGQRTNAKLLYRFESCRWLWMNKVRAWFIYREWKNKKTGRVWAIPEDKLTIGVPKVFKVGDTLNALKSYRIGVIVQVKEMPDRTECTVRNFRRHWFRWMNRLHAWWLVKTYKEKK